MGSCASAGCHLSQELQLSPQVQGKSGFLSKLEEAKAKVKSNILEPAAAKQFMEQNDGCLVLDVQDPGSESLSGSYNASLGTLYFKASTDLPDFKDPKIADLPNDWPIVITCALGGQAILGAALLSDYGFTNVKVIDGGCTAWMKNDLGSVPEAKTKEASGSKEKKGFLSKLEQAQKQMGDDVVSPTAAKAFITENSTCLVLDVQDPGVGSCIPGAYNASLGTLFFKASTDLADFKDSKIADRPSDAPILVTCALGGQAMLGAALLRDYGFSNVKVVDGGDAAWKKAFGGAVSAQKPAAENGAMADQAVGA